VPSCWCCKKDKALVAKPEDPLAPADPVTHNARIGQGYDETCGRAGCAVQVFGCFACHQLTGGSPRCEAHSGCEVDNGRGGTCGETIARFEFCSPCSRLFRRCRQRAHGVRTCPTCNSRTKDASAVEARRRELQTPVSVPIPVPVIRACPLSVQGNFADEAVAYAGLLADWLQSHGPSHKVDVGHQTLCVSFLEKQGEDEDPKIKVLITHSGGATYTGQYSKKRTIRYKVGRDAGAGRDDPQPTGMRQLGIAFMQANREAIGAFLARHKRTNPKNSIMLPECDPLVYYYRDGQGHYLLVPDPGGRTLAEQQALVEGKGPGLKAAAKFAETHAFCLHQTGSYDLDGSNAHHAEMRALKYATTFNYGVVAMAPTKGCCTAAERTSNCNGVLTGLGLIGRVPAERRTQSGYNAFLKQGGAAETEMVLQDEDEGEDETIDDIALMLAIAASLEDAGNVGEFVQVLRERFDIFPVTGDGNCLFAAVSLGIHQHEHNAASYRAEAVQYVYDHFSLEEVQAAWASCTSLDEYRGVMSVPAEHAGQVERFGGYMELVAISEMRGVEFHIHSAQWPDRAIVIPEDGLDEPELVVHLHYRNRNHYEVLFPRSG
jgi:hypothetical protein